MTPDGSFAGRPHEPEFTAFVQARGTALLRTAYALTGDRGHAEDLLQSALTKCYLGWGRIRDPRAAEAYVRRAIANTAVSWWRRPGWRRESSVEHLPVRSVADPSGAVDETDALWQAIATLSPRQRAVVALRYFDDLTEAETARMLGLSVGAVKSHGHRAITALRVRLSQPTSDAAGTATGGPR